MLGAIKVGAADDVSLFRRLSRNWRPLARVKRDQPALARALGVKEEQAKPDPAWIGVPRPRYVAVVALKRIPKRPPSSWNPWLWVK